MAYHTRRHPRTAEKITRDNRNKLLSFLAIDNKLQSVTIYSTVRTAHLMHLLH